jgi:sodium/hydrogen exchanger-like protein 6/7
MAAICLVYSGRFFRLCSLPADSILGIVSLLFCGITLKHYAYYNMSRRTQLTTKYLFQVLAQLSENFIFIYLGLSLFTDTSLVFRPVLVLVATVGICLARWAAVFPLSKLINFVIRKRAQARGRPVAEELPHSYQAMLFWAGLRGAVGVALAAGFTGENDNSLRATVLVVVVLTVIVFGGTTARMLEILGIRTGVVEEPDSDDEFDIESSGPRYGKPTGFGNTTLALGAMGGGGGGGGGGGDLVGFSSGQSRPSPPARAESALSDRRGDPRVQEALAEDESDVSDASDLPPAAPGRKNTLLGMVTPSVDGSSSSSPLPGPAVGGSGNAGMSATGAIGQLAGIFGGSSEDQAEWFRKIDEGFIKPKLLLDQGGKGNGGSPA